MPGSGFYCISFRCVCFRSNILDPVMSSSSWVNMLNALKLKCAFSSCTQVNVKHSHGCCLIPGMQLVWPHFFLTHHPPDIESTWKISMSMQVAKTKAAKEVLTPPQTVIPCVWFWLATFMNSTEMARRSQVQFPNQHPHIAVIVGVSKRQLYLR